MAKTKRSKKSKQEQLSEALQFRIIMAVCLFLVIVATLRLGPIGEYLNYICTYILGNFVGIGYLILIVLAIYAIYYAKLPRLSGPNAVGCYLLIGSVLTFMSALNDNNVTGIKVINQYFNQAPCNRGGVLGALFYGLLSALFDKMGALIAAGFILIIAIAMLGSKYYVSHRKKRPTKKRSKKEVKQSGKFIDFFTKKKDAFFFPDEVFENKIEPEIKDTTRIHTVHLQEDDTASSTMEFDEKSMTLEIKEKEPKIHDENSKIKQKINKN